MMGWLSIGDVERLGLKLASMSARPLRAAAPWFVLVLGLVLTGVATAYVSQSSIQVDRLRFERWVRDATADVLGGMRRQITLLEGVAGLFAASEAVSLRDFRAYVNRLNVAEHYPGLRGVGFAKRVPVAGAAEAERRVRAERPGFTIWPPDADRDYMTIVYLEPEDLPNAEAIGYNMAIEPTRWEAMRRAAETGEAAATRRVTLVQEITEEKQPGFLIYVPVYRGGAVPMTVEERLERLHGFAYSPFRSGDLLDTLFPSTMAQHVVLRLYDGPHAEAAALLYDSDPSHRGDRGRFRSLTSFDAVPGRMWTLEIIARPTFGSADFGWALSVLTLLCGTVSTVVLFGVTLALTNAHRAAQRAMEQLQHSKRALLESDARLQLALSAGELFAFSWDILTDSLILTDSAKRILGRTPRTADELLAVVHDDDRGHVERQFARSAAGLPHEMAFRVVGPRGEVRWLRERAVVQTDEHGGPRRVIGMCADVTEQKHTEQELRSLNETLELRVAERTLESEQRTAQLRALAGELTQAEQRERRRLAQVLHDHLQQLLVAAMMRVGVVRSRAADPPQADQLEQVDGLIRQAIESSRSLTVELSPPVLYDVGLARGLEWLARSMQDKHRLTVELDLQEGADTHDEDLRAFLFQAARELLFNAVKHAGDGATTRVRLWRTDDELHVAVSDDGPGFDPAVLRVRGAKAEHFGLFSVQQRLELLGGRMIVDSQPGDGTRIIMSVPLRLPRESLPPPEEVESDQHLAAEKLLQTYVVNPEEGMIRVVLADDHDVLREGLAAMLETQPDIRLVGEAADGEEAVALARELRPDAIVIDVTMPRMDGIEAARRIHEELPEIRVIGLSMHEAQEVGIAMREAGASAYLSKSAPSEQLLDVIRGLCGAESSAASGAPAG